MLAGMVKKTNAKKYLFCFDFDKTLVDGHFHAELSKRGVLPGQATESQINSLLEQYAILHHQELLETLNLILAHGHYIAITTWSNYPEVIEPTLRKIGLTEDAICRVHIQAGMPSDQSEGKGAHIARAKQYFGITENAHICLIDDDQDNIDQARDMGYRGFRVEHPNPNAKYLKKIQGLVKHRVEIQSVKSNECEPSFQGSVEADLGQHQHAVSSRVVALVGLMCVAGAYYYLTLPYFFAFSVVVITANLVYRNKKDHVKEQKNIVSDQKISEILEPGMELEKHRTFSVSRYPEASVNTKSHQSHLSQKHNVKK